MEEILKESEKTYDKIKLIESFISLHLRRDNIEPHIQELVMKFEFETAMKEHQMYAENASPTATGS